MLVTLNSVRLKEEREKQKISHRTLTCTAETSERYVRDLEKGNKTNPSAEMLFRISIALNVPMNDLMTIVQGED